MLERGLRAAGYRTGRYISPHLVRLEERFAIDGTAIEPTTLEAAAERIRDAAGSLPSPPSFFEATTAMALDIFREARVDVAILEVGLGGRLDATNVVQPVGVAITAIDFDHEQYLGHTIEAIAREKAGVIKPGIVAVLGQNPSEVQGVVTDACTTARAEFVYAPDGVSSAATLVEGQARMHLRTVRHDYGEITLALRGRHQVDNAVVAVRLLEELAARKIFNVPPDAVRTGLTEVTWPGRLELLEWRGGQVLLDGAHNPAGARALAAYVRDTYGRRLPFVVGVMKDKRIADVIAALAPSAAQLVCTRAASPRAATPDELATIATAVASDVPVQACARPMDALIVAREHGSPVVAAGSLYLVGEIRDSLT
jgi:dihydrofolate synthase/folylpolyglutamate synthase